MSVFLKLMWFFKQQWIRYGIAVFALVGVGLATMIPPWMIGKIVDSIADNSISKALLINQVSWILGAALVSYILRVTWRVALFGASYQLANQLRQQLFVHISHQSPKFFQKMKTGDLMARATNDIQAIEMTAGEAVLALFDGAFTGLLVLVMMTFFISFPLTMFSLIPWPIVGYFMWRFGRELHQSFRDAQARFSDLNDDVQESISALRLTRAFGREQAEADQFNKIASAANEANQRVAKTDSKYKPVIQLGVGFSFFLSVAGGAWFIHQGELTLGQLTSFTLYLGYMIWPMFAIGWLLNLVERGQAAYQRIDELLHMDQDIKDDGDVEKWCSPQVTFAVDAFQFSDSNKNVLENIQLKIETGHSLGIVGHTGAGKTTLINLLLRLEEHEQSVVKIDGIPIREFSLNNLRRHIATVPQNAFLFSTSIAANIALAKPTATESEIEAAAKIAQVHEDIMNFSNGYQTEVGERGVTLSGGQKQRIAIARALLQDSPILVLDDALSAVDVATEQSILTHLRQARENRTTIIVCHRLSAVETAEQIIVINHGEVTEKGDHKTLLKKKGWYRKMFDYQQLENVVEQGR